MADTLVKRLTGQTCADTVPVEVQVLVPVEALLDPTSPIPGEVPGHGPVPLDRLLPGAQAIRRLLTRDGIIIGGDSRQRAFTGVLNNGPTSFGNGRGLCEFHNLVRENPGWPARRIGHRIVTTTPTGHTYESDDRSGTTAGRPRTQRENRHAA